MARFRLYFIALSGLCLPGCCSDSSTELSHDRRVPPPQVTPNEPVAPAARTSPPSASREQQFAEAMRGLLYDRGTVEFDPDLAPQIVPDPDPARAAGERDVARREFQNGRFPESIAGYTRAVLHDFEAVESYQGLASVLMRAGRARETAAACRSALERDDSHNPTRVTLATAAQMLGRYTESAEQWREIYLREPDHPNARARRAVLLYLRGDYVGAWDQLHEAESLGQSIPPQLREKLAEQMPEPP